MNIPPHRNKIGELDMIREHGENNKISIYIPPSAPPRWPSLPPNGGLVLPAMTNPRALQERERNPKRQRASGEDPGLSAGRRAGGEGRSRRRRDDDTAMLGGCALFFKVDCHLLTPRLPGYSWLHGHIGPWSCCLGSGKLGLSCPTGTGQWMLLLGNDASTPRR